MCFYFVVHSFLFSVCQVQAPTATRLLLLLLLSLLLLLLLAQVLLMLREDVCEALVATKSEIVRCLRFGACSYDLTKIASIVRVLQIVGDKHTCWFCNLYDVHTHARGYYQPAV